MTYYPDPSRYQQLVVGGSTGPYDCTAHSAAWITDAHTQGGTKISGRSVRLNSDEPRPDPSSPGLNLPQTDAAVYKLTSGKVNLDTRVQAQAMTRVQAQSLIIDGRWAVVQLTRGILVDRTSLTGFRGGHAATAHARPIDNAPVIGDPLHDGYVTVSWDALWDAAEDFVRRNVPARAGKVYVQFTRDLTPDYRVVIHPSPGHSRVAFFRYLLNPDGSIRTRTRHRTGGFSAVCSQPKWHTSSIPHMARQLVQATSGSYKGWWLDARYAAEVIP